MTALSHITVAPNGARLGKRDHPALPLSLAETVATAIACQAAGAKALHLHIRDAAGRHSLDAGRYAEALAELARQAPAMDVQITTEAAGRYSVADQLALLARLRPQSASIAIREIARDPDLASRVYAIAADCGTRVQHILYGNSCLAQYDAWVDQGVLSSHEQAAILVLGQYAPPVAARPRDLAGRFAAAQGRGLDLTVCAFGRFEHDCLVAAAAMGLRLRVGFENSLQAPDGTRWRDNAQSVASLSDRLQHEICQAATPPAERAAVMRGS